MYNSITVAELNLLIGRVLIIDIRKKEKYLNGHITGASNIGYDELLLHSEKYLKKDQKYYVYCDYGSKSLTISRMLSKKGYYLITLIGGYSAWGNN